MTAELPYDLRRQGRLCKIVLTILLVLEVCLGATSVFALVQIQAAQAGQVNPTIVLMEREFWWSDLALTVVAVPYLIAYITALIVNGIWIYRATANAALLVPSEKRVGPGWAVGSFFIPIVNLFWPFRAMKETWNSSLRADGDLTVALPGWISLWWGAWLLSNILGQISTRMVEDTTSLETYAISTIIDIVNTPVAFLAAFLFRRLIHEVTEAQAMPARRLEEVFA